MITDQSLESSDFRARLSEQERITSVLVKETHMSNDVPLAKAGYTSSHMDMYSIGKSNHPASVTATPTCL